MRDKYILTAESVTEGHPDKLCDTIADRVLDACLKHDPAAHVACEAMAASEEIPLCSVPACGEDSTRSIPSSFPLRNHSVGLRRGISVLLENNLGSPPEPSEAVPVGRGGARERTQFSPEAETELSGLCDDEVLAHRLTLALTNARKTGTIQGLGPDGKAQVSVEYQKGKPRRIAAVVVSCQHDADKDLDELRREITRLVIVPALRELYPDHMTEVLINPSGRFVLGGFEADTGLTGRKLMVDTYGGLIPHGGGALSGKDASKVDRSGTYMARYIAKNIVAAGLAERCAVSLAYAIGRAEPVAVDVDLHEAGRYPEAVLEQAVREVFDLIPDSIIRTFRGPRCNPAKRLQWGEEEGMEWAESSPQAGTQQSGISSDEDRPIFAPFCNYGHFTHQDAPWEQTARTAALTEACGREDQGASHER